MATKTNVEISQSVKEGVNYKVGDKFLRPAFDEVYMLVALTENRVVLVNWNNGCSINKPVEVVNFLKITCQEFKEITTYAANEFVFIKEVDISVKSL